MKINTKILIVVLIIVKMEQKKLFIKSDRRFRNETAEKFETSVRTVQAALSFETRSPFSRMIRKYAIEQGCQVFEVKPVDEVVSL